MALTLQPEKTEMSVTETLHYWSMISRYPLSQTVFSLLLYYFQNKVKLYVSN